MKRAIDKYNNKTVVKSHKELFRIVQKSIEQYNEIRLENLQIICKIDTSVFLHKKGIPIDFSSDNIIIDYTDRTLDLYRALDTKQIDMDFIFENVFLAKISPKITVPIPTIGNSHDVFVGLLLMMIRLAL